jgi:hypothetical protein
MDYSAQRSSHLLTGTRRLFFGYNIPYLKKPAKFPTFCQKGRLWLDRYVSVGVATSIMLS